MIKAILELKPWGAVLMGLAIFSDQRTEEPLLNMERVETFKKYSACIRITKKDTRSTKMKRM